MNEQIFIHQNGKRQGPFNLGRIETMAKSGEIAEDALCWSPDDPEWKPAHLAFPQLLPPPLDLPSTSKPVPNQEPGVDRSDINEYPPDDLAEMVNQSEVDFVLHQIERQTKNQADMDFPKKSRLRFWEIEGTPVWAFWSPIQVSIIILFLLGIAGLALPYYEMSIGEDSFTYNPLLDAPLSGHVMLIVVPMLIVLITRLLLWGPSRGWVTFPASLVCHFFIYVSLFRELGEMERSSWGLVSAFFILVFLYGGIDLGFVERIRKMTRGDVKDLKAIADYLSFYDNNKMEIAPTEIWCMCIFRGTSYGLRQALPWYYKAAKIGDKCAAYIVGESYGDYRYKGFPEDQKKAAYWFQVAARRGHDDAVSALAEQLVTGKGVIRNPLQAVKLLMANDQPYELVRIHTRVEPDSIKAVFWLDHSQGKCSVEELEHAKSLVDKKFTEEQIRDARQQISRGVLEDYKRALGL